MSRSNRTNRGLLFGARPPPAAEQVNAQDSEAVENDNQNSIEHLRGSAGAIKDIALHVDASVNDQNRMLDKMVRLLFFLCFFLLCGCQPPPNT